MTYMARIHPRLPHGLVSCILLLSLFTFSLAAPKMLNDPDTAWHIATGDLIRELGKLPETDPWAFTSGGEQWLNMAWAWDVLVSWLHEKGGLELVVASHIVLGSVMFALLAWSCLLRGAGIVATIVTVMVGIILVAQSFSVRSYHFSYLFIVLFHMALHAHDEGKLPGRWLWGLPLLFVLWVNFHGGFLVTFTLLGTYGLAALLERDWRKFRLLFLVGLACLLGMLATPLGIDIFEIARRTKDSALLEIVSEWRPFKLEARALPIVLYLLGVLWLINPLRTGTNRAEMLLIYFWLGLSMTAMRHISIFALISAPSLAAALHQLLTRGLGQTSDAAVVSEAVYARALNKPRLRLMLSAAALLLISAVQSGFLLRWLHPKGMDFAENIRPKEEIAFVLAHYPDTRFMTFYDYGGYIIYATRGRFKVFIDGRGEAAYPPEAVKDYITFNDTSPGLRKVLDKYAIEGLFVPKLPEGVTEDRYPEFDLVHSGEIVNVFIRKRQP